MSNLLIPPSENTFYQFVSTPLDMLLAEHQTIDPEDKVLAMFHHCAKAVPAYQKFLKAHGVSHSEISS